MVKYYNIANLIVAMDSFGRTIEQAEPYRCEPCEEVDITIRSDWEALKKTQPHLSMEDCEYMCTGGSFYRQLLTYDGLLLHSSAVVVDGKAYLFSAPCGTGKSTHTKLWMKVFGDKVVMLNDDKPALRLENGVWYAYGTPWSGKHDISTNIRAEVAGIAMIERAESNYIERFSGPQAIFAVMEQTARPGVPALRMKLLENLDKLLSDVPLWKLHCNMEPEAAIVAYEAMSGKRKEI